MKQTIGFSQFCDAFRDAGRNNHFSYEGKQTLFDWLEMFEEETGQEMELDVIALCCEFVEADWQVIADNYNIEMPGCEDDEEREAVVEEYLNNNTMLCGSVCGGFVYAAF